MEWVENQMSISKTEDCQIAMELLDLYYGEESSSDEEGAEKSDKEDQ